MGSRFRFAARDAYFVHKTVSMLFFSPFRTGVRVLRPLLRSTEDPGVPVQTQGTGSSLVPGTLKMQRRPQMHLCQLRNRVTINRNPEYVSENSSIKQGAGSFTSL